MVRVLGTALLGVDGIPVEVEVRVSAQLPRVDIVGLPELSVRESAARVRAAIASVGERFPDNRVTVNLAPAGLRKSGSGLDLAIAVGILVATGAIDSEATQGLAFVGELALDGRLRGVRGELAMSVAARDAGCHGLIAPARGGRAAARIPGLEVYVAETLAQVLAHLRGERALDQGSDFDPSASEPEELCISDVKGQEGAKRALEIAAAGGHGLLLSGPPGCGKTMLARRLPGILPPLNEEEALTATIIHDAAGLLSENQTALRSRPFRSPHHTASLAGLLGGGTPPTPGEVSLAHGGVLFLDELPEFERRAREALRQVLEDRSIVIARAHYTCRLPADFMFVATANPCPCGWWGSQQRPCRCDGRAIQRYRERLSGPLLDRIDLHVRVPGQNWHQLGEAVRGPNSARVRARIQRARQKQQERAGACNANLDDRQLEAELAVTDGAQALLARAVDQFCLSARAIRRVQRVARTVADLGGAEGVDESALAEALGFREEAGGRPED
ncbi:MAG: YifB family Mg chelatase-like AAA ATPase [Myxococcota bacterium]|nr:YifB family Mg chelatase-like AAA ATPase [Myxococcota bacterium]